MLQVFEAKAREQHALASKSHLFLHRIEKILTNILLYNLILRNMYYAYSVPRLSSYPRHR
jgi:hypothetical protein